MSLTPRLQVESGKVVLTGQWTLAALLPGLKELEARLAGEDLAALPWDLSSVSRLDSAAAVLLWRTWNERWPVELVASEMQRRALERVAAMPSKTGERRRRPHPAASRRCHRWGRRRRSGPSSGA